MQDPLERWSQLLGAIDGDAEYARGLCDFREIRIHEIDPAVEKPCCPHLERGLHVTNDAQIEPRPASELLATQIDLDGASALREKLLIREVHAKINSASHSFMAKYPDAKPRRPVIPTSNGLSYSMNSFPRIAWTTGAAKASAVATTSACVSRQPAPPRIVTFVAPFKSWAAAATSVSDAQIAERS